jgi:hypothetical protein
MGGNQPLQPARQVCAEYGVWLCVLVQLEFGVLAGKVWMYVAGQCCKFNCQGWGRKNGGVLRGAEQPLYCAVCCAASHIRLQCCRPVVAGVACGHSCVIDRCLHAYPCLCYTACPFCATGYVACAGVLLQMQL